MKLTFIGADHEVTGSAHLVEVGNKKFLIDYGMEQGKNLYENISLPVPESEIDYVFITHAHMDHTGLLPLLYKNGFRGTIYAQNATVDLSQIMLKDSAHIQEFEAEWRNRKAKRSGAPKYEPVYTMDDAIKTLELFVGVEYNKKVEIDENITVRFNDMGHLLGSASIECWLKEGNIEKKIVFSGDVGNYHQPIIKDPQPVKEADYVLVESTYGDRLHEGLYDYVPAFAEILNETFDKGGNVVIPSFAVGRTQEILYFIREIKTKDLVPNHKNFKVIIDSPLAISATEVFDKHSKDCYDEEAITLINNGIKPFIFDGLTVATTSEESQAINFDTTPKVIISASGMCEAGRIRHHLKHNLWRSDSTIVFVGYQAAGTIGRKLLDGEKTVKLFGDNINVNATITQLPGMSGHADENGLLTWLKGFENKPEKIFVVHGEDYVTDSFAQKIKDEIGINAYAPYSGAKFDIATGDVISLGVAKPIDGKVSRSLNSGANVAKNAYRLLLNAGQKLMAIIRKNEELSNDEIKKFTVDIENVCKKWDK